MIKPNALKKGDKIAAISLSWGGAGECKYRFDNAVRQIRENFEIDVVPTRHALRSAEWIYNNPKARAEDLLEALSDNSIQGIFSNIGGEDSIRTLPFMDYELIRNNPKVFIGFSDTTVSHFCFYKAGVTSFYGTSMLVGFAENAGMHPYQIEDIKRSLFSTNPIGQIPVSKAWTSERLEWLDPANESTPRLMTESRGWRFLQGQGRTEGALLGGCVEVFEFVKATSIWPSLNEWKDKIMFLETSEEMLNPSLFRRYLRNYAAIGIFNEINGLIVGRPYNNKHWKAYDNMLIEVIRNEQGLDELPIITGMDFGHTCPTFTIPYGVQAAIDCDKKTFEILESGLKM